MAKSIAFITRGAPHGEAKREAIQDLLTASDRAAAIIAGSIIEVELTEALKAYLHRDKKITDELFRTTGALGAFATKIHVGHLIGLYGKSAYKDLLIVKNIRNEFAHSLEVSSFKSDRIKSWAQNLKLCERYSIDQKDLERKNSGRKMGGDLPLKDWDFWVIVKDRAEALRDPRERYLITLQVFTQGLIVPNSCAMPEPTF